MFAAPVPLATFTVKLAGMPAEIVVVGPVMLIPVRGLSPTVTSAVLPATLAVTFAVRVVVSIVRATPS